MQRRRAPRLVRVCGAGRGKRPKRQMPTKSRRQARPKNVAINSRPASAVWSARCLALTSPPLSPALYCKTLVPSRCMAWHGARHGNGAPSATAMYGGRHGCGEPNVRLGWVVRGFWMESDCATYLWIVGAAWSGTVGPRRPRPRSPAQPPSRRKTCVLDRCHIPHCAEYLIWRAALLHSPHHTTKPDPANLETVNDHAEQAQIVAFGKGSEQFSRHHFCRHTAKQSSAQLADSSGEITAQSTRHNPPWRLALACPARNAHR